MQCLNNRDVYKVREPHVPLSWFCMIFSHYCCILPRIAMHHPQNYPELFPKK